MYFLIYTNCTVYQQNKPREGQAGGGGKKIISFITALDGNDQVKFTEYEGDTPICWNWAKDPKIFYLEADDTVSVLQLLKSRSGVIWVEQV